MNLEGDAETASRVAGVGSSSPLGKELTELLAATFSHSDNIRPETGNALKLIAASQTAGT